MSLSAFCNKLALCAYQSLWFNMARTHADRNPRDFMTTPRRQSSLFIACMLLILLVAAGTRLYNLGGQSLWYDEGVAYGHSQRTLWEMIPRLQDNVHVPAYFGSLALYEDAVGSTEFGLRSYSVLWSLISVAGVYALGKRLYSPWAGISAALFVALNSFSIYYAQEARMYAMLSGVGVMSIWAFVRWAQVAFRRDVRVRQLVVWAAAFAAFNIIGQYTHVSYALVMLTQGMLATVLLCTLLYRAIREDERYWRTLWFAFQTYTVANLVTVGLFTPWLFVALSQISAQPNISDVIPWQEAVRIIQGWFAFGRTFPEGMGGMNVVAYFLLLFGVLTLTDERKNAVWYMLVPVVWVLLSTGIYLYLELYTRYLRFLLPAQIGFALWMGHGVWVLWSIVPDRAAERTGWQRQVTLYAPKIAPVVAVLAFGWQQFTILPPLYSADAYVRDDYRGLVATIERESDSDDAIILSAPGVQEIFGYYYDGALPVYPLPMSADIAGDTQAVINTHDHIYVVWFGQSEQDSEGVVAATLNQGAYPLGGEWVGDVRFEQYLAGRDVRVDDSLDVAFGDAIRLVGAGWGSDTAQAGDAIPMQLVWETDVALDVRYKVFVQVLNSDGVLVAQRDSDPLNGLYPTTLWQVGETITDRHGVLLPDDLPAGDYTLIVGLYDANDAAARLPVGEGDFYVLGMIVVE